jgi:hypothetical protein
VWIYVLIWAEHCIARRSVCFLASCFPSITPLLVYAASVSDLCNNRMGLDWVSATRRSVTWVSIVFLFALQFLFIAYDSCEHNLWIEFGMQDWMIHVVMR